MCRNRTVSHWNYAHSLGRAGLSAAHYYLVVNGPCCFHPKQHVSGKLTWNSTVTIPPSQPPAPRLWKGKTQSLLKLHWNPFYKSHTLHSTLKPCYWPAYMYINTTLDLNNRYNKHSPMSQQAVLPKTLPLPSLCQLLSHASKNPPKEKATSVFTSG